MQVATGREVVKSLHGSVGWIACARRAKKATKVQWTTVGELVSGGGEPEVTMEINLISGGSKAIAEALRIAN